MTSRGKPNHADRGIPREALRAVADVRRGRFEHTMSGLAASGVVTAAEIYHEHDSARFGNKWMWAPIVLAPLGAVFNQLLDQTGDPHVPVITMVDSLIRRWRLKRASSGESRTWERRPGMVSPRHACGACGPVTPTLTSVSSSRDAVLVTRRSPSVSPGRVGALRRLRRVRTTTHTVRTRLGGAADR
jgi:hypothetical protein